MKSKRIKCAACQIESWKLCVCFDIVFELNKLYNTWTTHSHTRAPSLLPCSGFCCVASVFINIKIMHLNNKSENVNKFNIICLANTARILNCTYFFSDDIEWNAAVVRKSWNVLLLLFFFWCCVKSECVRKTINQFNQRTFIACNFSTCLACKRQQRFFAKQCIKLQQKCQQFHQYSFKH